MFGESFAAARPGLQRCNANAPLTTGVKSAHEGERVLDGFSRLRTRNCSDSLRLSLRGACAVAISAPPQERLPEGPPGANAIATLRSQ